MPAARKYSGEIRNEKGEAAALGYDCVYRGYFRSGAVSGSAKNGELCRSQVNGDPLEGIELRIARA